MKRPIRLLAVLSGSLCLGIVYFLFNFLFMQRYIDYDQTFYLHNIESLMNPKATAVYIPNHLHFQAGARVFHFWVKDRFGNAGFDDLVSNTRLRSLLAASLGIIMAFLFFSSITGRLGFGILGALLVGVCHGYLLYATKIDTAIFPALGMLAVLFAFHRYSAALKHPYLLAGACGVALFVSVMFHQYMGFVCIACAAAALIPGIAFRSKSPPAPFLFSKEPSRPLIEKKAFTRYIGAFIIIIAGGALTLAGFFYAGETILNLPFDKSNPRKARFPFKQYTFQKWLFLYSSYQNWGKGLSYFNIKAPIRGFTNALVAPDASQWRRISSLSFPYNMRKTFSAAALPYNLIAAMTLFVIVLFIALFPSLWKRYGRDLAFIILAFGFLAIFSAYWEPKHIEFWVVPCILFCSLFILILNHVGEKLSIVFRGFAFIPLYAALFIVLAILGIHNLKNYVVPFTVTDRLEEINKSWEEDYYMKYFSSSIYKNPENPYQRIYRKEMMERYSRLRTAYLEAVRESVPEDTPE
jgi:hypothetical protein